MKKREDLKILLLQIRDDKETELEEYYEFLEFGGLIESQLDVINTFHIPDFKPDVLDGFDALFVGGSSDASMLHPEKYPFVKNCKALIRDCYEKDMPVFASCFGFQVAVEELGGKIILDHDNMEMGEAEILLTQTAESDPLLHDMPKTFWAVVGHKERAASLPTNATTLAYTPACPYHIFKLDDKPFYAFQFHPEVAREDLIARITRYEDRYFNDASGLQALVNSEPHDTLAANGLVAKFIDRILLPHLNQ